MVPAGVGLLPRGLDRGGGDRRGRGALSGGAAAGRRRRRLGANWWAGLGGGGWGWGFGVWGGGGVLRAWDFSEVRTEKHVNGMGGCRKAWRSQIWQRETSI